MREMQEFIVRTEMIIAGFSCVLAVGVCVCMYAQSCTTLCDPIDCSLPGSFVHGILQVRILELAVISFSRDYSRPRDQTQVFLIAGGLCS